MSTDFRQLYMSRFAANLAARARAYAETRRRTRTGGYTRTGGRRGSRRPASAGRERNRNRFEAAAGTAAHLAEIRAARDRQRHRREEQRRRIEAMMERIGARQGFTDHVKTRPTVESAQQGMRDMMENAEDEASLPSMEDLERAAEVYSPAVRAALRLAGLNISEEQIGETITNYYDLRAAQLDEALPALAQQLQSELGTDVVVDDARFAGWDDGRARYNVRVSSYTKDGSYIHSRMELRQRHDDSFTKGDGTPITEIMTGEVSEENMQKVLDAFAMAAQSNAENPHQAAVESLIADGIDPDDAAQMVTETMNAMYNENITWGTPLNRAFDIARSSVDVGLAIMAEMEEEERAKANQVATDDYGAYQAVVDGNYGGGGGIPDYIAPDSGMVTDFVRSMITTLIGIVPDGMLDKLTNIYLDAAARAFNGESIDPRQAVREAIRRTPQYKAIHRLRPDAISEDDWLATHIQALTAAGVRVGEIVERAIKQATAGVSPARAGEAGGISEFAGTGRANPKFIQDMSRVAATTFRRVF